MCAILTERSTTSAPALHYVEDGAVRTLAYLVLKKTKKQLGPADRLHPGTPESGKETQNH